MNRDSFAEELAAATPTPGGGAAAARVGLFACSLIRMVTGITLKKVAEGKVAAQPNRIEEIEHVQSQAIALSRRFELLEKEDMAAFQAYLSALQLPRSTSEEKSRRLEARRESAWRATRAPLDLLAAVRETLDLCGQLFALSRDTPLKAESDLGAAVELAYAAFRVGQLNVEVNLSELSDARREEAKEEWGRLRSAVESQYDALLAASRK